MAKYLLQHCLNGSKFASPKLLLLGPDGMVAQQFSVTINKVKGTSASIAGGWSAVQERLGELYREGGETWQQALAKVCIGIGLLAAAAAAEEDIEEQLPPLLVLLARRVGVDGKADKQVQQEAKEAAKEAALSALGGLREQAAQLAGAEQQQQEQLEGSDAV